MRIKLPTFDSVTRRHGKSLIELVLVIALIGVILPVASSMYVRLFRIDRESHIAVAKSLTASRLGNIFRDDVYAAISADLQANPVQLNGPQTLVLQAPEQTVIRYRPRTDMLIRTVTREKKVVHSETFRLPKLDVIFTLDSRQSKFSAVQMQVSHSQNTHQQIRVTAMLKRLSIQQSAMSIAGTAKE